MAAIHKPTSTFYTNNNTRYIMLDGAANTTLAACYTTLQSQLSIPNYFGHNLDALEEVMADLEWVAEAKVVLIIANTSQLLINDSEAKVHFIEILEQCENKNLEIIYLQELTK